MSEQSDMRLVEDSLPNENIEKFNELDSLS